MRVCPECRTEYPENAAFCGHDGTLTLEPPRPDQARDPRVGVRLGDYMLVARVADGAMGRVYEARHVQTRAKVAIKVLHDEVATDKVAVERFKREFETARDIGSPYVVRVHEFGETADRSFFLTMEFLEGQELGHLLRKEGAQPPARVLRILAQVALGLDDAHSFGVIHRDLKPDNLFLVRGADGDEVRILDFGSVKLQMETGPKLTAFGTTLGSPYYMSPEQAMGKLDVDNRTDVFALGAIAYEALSARIAFDGANVSEILSKLISQRPEALTIVRPGLPHALDDVLDRALAKDKKGRYGGAIALASALFGAFGLDVPAERGAVELWSKKTVAELEGLIASARASTPAPLPAPAAPLVQPAPAQPHAGGGQQNAFADEPALPRPSRAPLLVGGLVGLGALAALAYFLFGS